MNKSLAWYPLVFRRLAVLRSIDWFMMLAIATLILLGLSAIYSVDLSRESVGLLQINKQLIALMIGGIASVLIAVSNIHLLRTYHFALYIASCFFLLFVLFFGTTIRGATGWFSLGAIHFQPVELMKIALMVELASFFAMRSRSLMGWRELGKSAALTFVPVALTFAQPDFGSACVLLGIWFSLLLFAGLPKRFVLFLIVGITAFFMVGWFGFFADYQKARILTFLEPSSDPLGQGYNVNQALIAIGAGGWFGRGLGFGSQSQLKFLPESQTDFIFAVIAEELGFVGVLLILLAFVCFFLRLFHHAKRLSDPFHLFLLVGVGSAVLIQVCVNVGMNLGWFPVTGIGLPFVSYGGSSLVSYLILFGIVEGIAMKHGAFLGDL